MPAASSDLDAALLRPPHATAPLRSITASMNLRPGPKTGTSHALNPREIRGGTAIFPFAFRAAAGNTYRFGGEPPPPSIATNTNPFEPTAATPASIAGLPISDGDSPCISL